LRIFNYVSSFNDHFVERPRINSGLYCVLPWTDFYQFAYTCNTLRSPPTPEEQDEEPRQALPKLTLCPVHSSVQAIPADTGLTPFVNSANSGNMSGHESMRGKWLFQSVGTEQFDDSVSSTSACLKATDEDVQVAPHGWELGAKEKANELAREELRGGKGASALAMPHFVQVKEEGQGARDEKVSEAPASDKDTDGATKTSSTLPQSEKESERRVRHEQLRRAQERARSIVGYKTHKR
jgi:hypothetical protein